MAMMRLLDPSNDAIRRRCRRSGLAFPILEFSVPTDRLASLSQRMAALTLVFMCAMLVLNVLAWLLPLQEAQQYGISFGLSVRAIQDLRVDVAAFPWWQTAGAIVISSLPLLVLMDGLRHLRALFRAFAAGAYFSVDAAFHLGRVGRAVALWVVAEFLCEPVLSFWITMLAGPGNRVITSTIDSSAFVALFVACSIAVIARILGRASEVYEENRQFI